MTDVRVGIADMRVAKAPALLVAHGLGSCIGIALYDPELCLGGMAHTLLPYQRAGTGPFRVGKFVDSAIEAMLAELEARGAVRQRLWAKIFGGATMFRSPLHPEDDGIGVRNTRAAREILDVFGIPLVAEDIGGHHGRSVEFDLATGCIQIRSLRQHETVVTL
ncbi:MAG TPA: chemotaxis protein CheD [Desulfuromonadales bacterium]|nr:chemotaxis protein CheD [Desulfuromonadales bacterium]